MSRVWRPVCFQLLKEKGCTLATAESCTGGRVAERITALPGVSSVYRGGVVSYWTSVKAEVLGVPRTLLDQYGAVSEDCARAMAENARRITGADMAVSVTGVAGPDPDERDNPVGLVYRGAGRRRRAPTAGSWTWGSAAGTAFRTGRQPRLRYAAPLPDWTAGGAKRHRKTHGKAVKRDENRK